VLKNKPNKKLALKQVVSRAYSSTLNWSHVPPQRRLTFNGLHGVISQKTELFKRSLMNIILADGVAMVAMVCFYEVHIRKHVLEHVTSS
jgi:hypothetical protein